MTITTPTASRMTQLRWSCRRGMLELDLMLGQFLDRGFAALNSEEQTIFQELLNCLDPDLYAWLLGSVVPPDPQLAALVKKIQAYAPPTNPPKTL